MLRAATTRQSHHKASFPVGSFQSIMSQRSFSSYYPGVALVFSCVVVLGLLLPTFLLPRFSKSTTGETQFKEKWRSYTLKEALPMVARDGVVIVCAVSEPYLPFLSNWIISIGKNGRQDQVLVIAEDYATLYAVNKKRPGHAVLLPPAPPLRQAHKFGSQGFFNFTSRRPRHLLQILELGYTVLYNDVDMVWLKDPFSFFTGDFDIYFTDDMTLVKPENHSHALPPPGKKGRTYICSCMLFLRPTPGAKLVLRKWIEELEAQPWTPKARANDQPAFNWALNKTANKVNHYLLPQYAFPSGGLYFRNATWRNETKGQHVIVHNNYITGFEKKIKRFREFQLWFVADSLESALFDSSFVEK